MKIFDMHADIGTDCLENKSIDNAYKERHIEKLKAGEIKGIFTACYFDGTQNWQQMQEMVLNMKEQIGKNLDDIQPIITKDDLIDTNKILNVISVEGMCGIDKDFEERIEWLYKNGVRVAIPAWNESNAICEGWTGDPLRGLTEDGKRVIKKMNDLNMIIDVSHLNEKSFWEVISLSKKPVIASHSNFRNICPHGRNLTEQQLRAIANKGGIIGINAASMMSSTDLKLRNVDTLAKHAKAMADIVGVEHIACGFDFMDYLDGWNEEDLMVDGLPSCDKAQNFVAALERQGFLKEEIAKICFENTFNFLKENL